MRKAVFLFCFHCFLQAIVPGFLVPLSCRPGPVRHSAGAQRLTLNEEGCPRVSVETTPAFFKGGGRPHLRQSHPQRRQIRSLAVLWSERGRKGIGKYEDNYT